MENFRDHTEEPERMTVNAVLDGVNQMLERLRLNEVPANRDEARGWRMAISTAQNALCRGEWQR